METVTRSGSRQPDQPTERRTHRYAARVVFAGGVLATMLAITGGPASAGLIGSLTGTLTKTTGALVGTVTGTLGTVTGALHLGSLGDEFSSDSTVQPQLSLGQVASAIGADPLRLSGINGHGVDVALIDTGAVPVPALSSPDAVVNGPDLSFDHQAGTADGLDTYGHGTHMAGIIAARGDTSTEGIAPGSRLVNMKVGSSDGAVDVSQVIASIDWVVEHRHDNGLNIRVINLSYGTDSTQPYQVDPLAHAVESAWRNGIVVVTAAGNSGGALIDPASDPFVVTVGAADLGGNVSSPSDDSVASFSSVGSAARRVDLVAPGTSIVSLRNPGSTIDTAHPEARVGTAGFVGSGTSQATAVVSGAVADLLQERPSLTPDQVKAVLRSTARPIAGGGPGQGAGMINIGAAATAPLLAATAQHFTPGTGTGSLELSRGTGHVAIDGVELTGEIDVQGAPWTPAIWAPLSSDGTAWIGGVWNGSEWAGDSWLPVGSPEWTGSTWRGSTWRGSTWRGSTWTGSTWRGSTWRAATWTGSTWRSL
jgi:serine protease AprX